MYKICKPKTMQHRFKKLKTEIHRKTSCAHARGPEERRRYCQDHSTVCGFNAICIKIPALRKFAEIDKLILKLT